ncbi:DUF4876 domain-containing protein [Chitinophaga nivalis]|uniref:DUF4876 domain-containing protein n=1 Tax=Chitinophaga nivalis TaxID=2991709 RepID=A0ABT3IUM6_9BACT|nr:DUF4876 domain-containing protein [Chitinophaga nivalis]MCW3462906.1 DUF4876 domain-containing protein [Chitinophaga nivalis]MCW3487404.1 DUF4876 domain-containing protein [Chitinophaga nivalis]
MRLLQLFLLAGIVGLVASCKKDQGADVQPVSLQVQVQYDAETQPYGFEVANAKVKIVNVSNREEYTGVANAAGVVVFNSLYPGSYDIVATQEIAAAVYKEKTGIAVENSVTFNVSLTSQRLVADLKVDLQLKAARVGDWMIKQVYYAGSDTKKGAVQRDQFIELYNNSNKVLYADSLYFGLVEGVNTPLATLDQTKGFYLPSGQWNWLKSIGMSDAGANTNYVYMASVYRVPSNAAGNRFPVQPGASFIIAQTALNHKTPFVDINGKPYSVQDPSLTVDLSQADLEIYLGNQPGINPLATDLDMPAPNADVIDRGGHRDFVIDNNGRDGVVIFRTAETHVSWKKYPSPDEKTVTAETRKFNQIPVSWVIDGIGLQQAVPSKKMPKRMIDAVDASETFVPAGSYSSQSLIRKTAKVVNGRRTLQDTNNSANDFGFLDRADASKKAFKD